MKCKTCKAPFTKQRAMQATCSIPCALAFVAARKEKMAARFAAEERRLTAQARVRLKTRSELAQEAQAAVNAYVRLRDAALPCVSCGRPPTWGGQWHASHFRSVGAATSLRFNLFNIHKACSICNNWKSGNLLEYKKRLVERIGREKMEWLETQNSRADYSRDYLIRLKKVFAKKGRRLERRNTS